MTVRSHRARIAGSDAHWVTAGSGSPVVLVHGLGNSAMAWRRVIPGLARDHRVIAPDLPGCGQSSEIAARDMLEAYTHFVEELIEHASPGVPVALVGNSIGGAVALRLALTRTELVSRLVLVDPAGVGQGVPAWWRLVQLEGVVRLLTAVPLTLTPSPVLERVVGEAYRRMAFADPSHVSDRTVRLFARQLNSRERIHRFLRLAHAVVDSFEPDVQRLEHPLPVPVLAVWGREDRLVPLADALALLERLGGLEIRIIEDAAHTPQLEAPRAFLDAVGDFLAGNDVPALDPRTTSVRLQPVAKSGAGNGHQRRTSRGGRAAGAPRTTATGRRRGTG
ncbi:MAG TPA: alpha/beta fold hydrolase [Candidatus Dormibacteraeota bacterium]|jgi:pimeloyl-ACP methyl ester carboxylesterase|nr:alpha/beta fold hydrolase [Candidatus Dormibacteraeota bacterium]